MALGNYIVDGTYTKVDALQYSKTNKHIAFNIIFKTLQGHEALRSFSISANSDIPSILLTDALEKDLKKTGQWYYLGVAHTEHPNHLARWNSILGIWDYWYAQQSWNHPFYVEETGTYVELRDGTFKPCTCYNDIRIWNTYFNNELNQTKQIYLYLKSLPEFSSCTDI